jgi:dipeptidyl aminopeptidase/acylaminoacyl peptidase
MKLYKLLFAAALGALHVMVTAPALAQTPAATSAAAEIPLADFFKLPDFAGASLSPDGASVAYVRTQHGRLNLAVLDIASRKRTFVTNFNDVDVVSFEWVNAERLVYFVDDLKVGVGDNEIGGIRAVNRDGSGADTLTEGSLASAKSRLLGTSRGLPPRAQFYSRVRSGDLDDIIMIEGLTSPLRTTLMRVNTKNGRFTSLASGVPGNVVGWALDMQDQPRAVETLDKGVATIYVRAAVDKPWVKAYEYSIYESPGYALLRFGPDGQLYMSAAINRDTAAIYRFNWTTMKLDEQFVFASKDFDLGTLPQGGLIFDPKSLELTGVRYNAETTTTHWVSAELGEIQKTVDASLPGRFNSLAGSPNSKTGNVLVTSWTADTPTSYFLFDSKTKRLVRIGTNAPWFADKPATKSEFFRYAARDGLPIPSIITYPSGANPSTKLPLIVMVHGGPYVRGVEMSWDREVQVLASRGYAVLQTDFRGSRGHGWKHYKAGWKQWGLAMQDDLADGVAHVLKTGRIDPSRVCIAGASYGGYATVMGLIKHPEIYKCGVSWVGVTDISLLYSVGWSDTAGSDWARFGMPVLVGDLDKDREQIKATSAVEQAARLKSPLILAYGTADVRVPFDHGKALMARLRGHNPNAEYIEYPGEGHGWRVVENNVDFWGRTLKFLDRHIGKK